jgi:deoxyribodipyrimidine photo-lyase
LEVTTVREQVFVASVPSCATGKADFMISIVWFRLDLRLADNPALHAAVKRGGAIVPVFIHAPEEEAPWAPGAASCWWLHGSLTHLENQLREAGSRLVVRHGPTLGALRTLSKETAAQAIFWNRRYEPAVRTRDLVVEKALQAEGIEVETFNAALLHEPSSVQNQSGKPFQVFTPFWKHCLKRRDPEKPLPRQQRIPAPPKWPKSLPIAELELMPKINWAAGLTASWRPGEAGALGQLQRFVARGFHEYAEFRDRPDLSGTSRLSPHLHFGEISPRQVWHAVAQKAARRGLAEAAWRNSRFVTELGWREFAHHLLFYFPDTANHPLRAEFKDFAWRQDTAALKAWQQGRTGYPIVDAGMRQLWATGWMHNRVRMIVVSFLVKDLLISWENGARWFWDTLVDADLAQNTLGWQWTAGCGADAAPFFRIFNPTTQGTKFDPKGDYVRCWCPELGKLPAPWLHQPDAAPSAALVRAAIALGKTYPKPIVNHAIAREVALAAFVTIRKRGRNGTKPKQVGRPH